MRRDVKKAWVAALCSGEYRQTTGTLANCLGHCCLGVLTEVLNKQFPEVYVESRTQFGKTTAGIAIRYGTAGYRTSFLPESLLYDIGILSQIQGELSLRNDNGASFQEIAAYIQENL